MRPPQGLVRWPTRPERKFLVRDPPDSGWRADQVDQEHQRQPVHTADYPDQRRQHVHHDEDHEDKDPEPVAIRKVLHAPILSQLPAPSTQTQPHGDPPQPLTVMSAPLPCPFLAWP